MSIRHHRCTVRTLTGCAHEHVCERRTTISCGPATAATLLTFERLTVVTAERIISTRTSSTVTGGLSCRRGRMAPTRALRFAALRFAPLRVPQAALLTEPPRRWPTDAPGPHRTLVCHDAGRGLPLTTDTGRRHASVMACSRVTPRTHRRAEHRLFRLRDRSVRAGWVRGCEVEAVWLFSVSMGSRWALGRPALGVE